MRSEVAQDGQVSPVLFQCVYERQIPTLSRHVQLAQNADDTDLVATSVDHGILSDL